MAYSSTASFSASMFSHRDRNQGTLLCGARRPNWENKFHQLNRKRVDGFGGPCSALELFGSSEWTNGHRLGRHRWRQGGGGRSLSEFAARGSQRGYQSQGLYGRVGRWRRGRMACTPVGLGRWRRLRVDVLAVASVCRVTVCALTVDSAVPVSRSKPDVACPSAVGGFEEEEADSSASSIDDAAELECGGSDEAGDFADGPVADPESADPDVEDAACEPDD